MRTEGNIDIREGVWVWGGKALMAYFEKKNLSLPKIQSNIRL